MRVSIPLLLTRAQGAGSDIGAKIRAALTDVLRALVAARTPTAGLSGLLNSFAIKWATEADFQFLSQCGILQMLFDVIHVPAEPRPATGRTTRKLALRTLELLALNACRGAKKVEEGDDIGAAQAQFLQELADHLYTCLSQSVEAKAGFYTPLDGSSLTLAYVIFLDLLSGSATSRHVTAQPRWLPLLATLATQHNVPMQLAALRVLRKVLPLHSPVAAPVVKIAAAPVAASFKSAISAAFSSAVPKAAAEGGKEAKEAEAKKAAEKPVDAMAVCCSLLTFAGKNLRTSRHL